MPRQSQVSSEYNFKEGLITQATGLNFPENACTETFNCIFKETGEVSRRPQFDFERNYVTETINRTNQAISTFLWKAVAEEGDFSVTVLQVGSKLYFYDNTNPNSLSQGFYVGQEVDLTTYFSASTNQQLQECTYATGLGYLFVFHTGMDPIYVSYNASTRTFSASSITLQIRDLVGVDDALTVDTRPTGTITNNHKYNLYNQGWNVPLSGTSPYTAWDTARADFPSNADVWWDFKNASDAFDLTYVANISRGTAPAPKGYYVLDLFNQQRDSVSGVPTISDVVYTARPSIGTFFAGRVWYAGIPNADLNNNLYYSQVIDSVTQFGHCYQTNDPTNETLSLLLPTDGGSISILEMGTVLHLEVIGNYLIIWATNGIWYITGSEGVGFRATDYTVGEISKVKSISTTNFVNISTAVMWWNADGIWVLQAGQQGGFQVQSISDQRIKDFFREIPAECKKQARGTFNGFTHTVQWLYRTTETNDLTDRYEYDGILNLNVLSGAFYPWTISSGVPKVLGVLTDDVAGQSLIFSSDVVDNATNNVVDSSGNQVIAFSYSAFAARFTTTKFLTAYPSGSSHEFTWSEVVTTNTETDYRDWYTYDSLGVDYDSYFITGYKLHGEGQRSFQANYLYVFSNTSLVLPIFDVRARWDYATSGNTGRWNNKQRVTFSLDNYTFQRKKLKIRGNGITVQFNFSSVTGKPFNLAGWSVYETQQAGI